MNEPKQYRNDLLEWCKITELNWESMNQRYSELFNHESLKDWEDSYRQLKAKILGSLNADLDDYETAKNLYDQLVLFYRESNEYQDEMEIDTNQSLEWEEQILEDCFETDAFQEESELESERNIDLEEREQYREELLGWSHNLYSNWTSMKPKLSFLVDNESLEELDKLYRQITEKLQEDIKPLYPHLKTHVLDSIAPFVKYKLEEAKHRSYAHALQEVAAITYLMGNGMDPQPAYLTVESWEINEMF
ncbi:hypothetical protein V7075_14350 [Neobacillus drentensis]|uniref:hypothetical protein n=1 Tax=Neobacillus drentensis TaxID=220684 RepID=UPI002FFE5A17